MRGADVMIGVRGELDEAIEEGGKQGEFKVDGSRSGPVEMTICESVEREDVVVLSITKRLLLCFGSVPVEAALIEEFLSWS